MNSEFDKIHNELVNKCNLFPFIQNEIIKNGVITIKDNKLDLFAFLIQIIISQQISDKASKTIWKKLCEICKTPSLTISNFPNIHSLKYALDKVNIPMYKQNYIIDLFKSVSKKKIDIDKLITMDEENIRASIVKHKGLGPWTSDMFLIFYLKKKNVFPDKDLVINKMKLKLEEKEKRNINFIENFSPFLSIFSLHLWKMSKRVL